MSGRDVEELLAPLRDESELSSRRLQVNRDKIVSRMVEVSLAPEERGGGRSSSWARWLGGLALAASLALAAWGGSALWRGGAAVAEPDGIEILALRGNVTASRGVLRVGEPLRVSAAGTLETAPGAQARITARAGLQIELLEGTKVSLAELAAAPGAAALRLERGRVRCVIEHRPDRTFEVVTPGVRVIDVGTVFSVDVHGGASGPVTAVRVEEGAVLVQHAGGRAQLQANQTWTNAVDLAPPVEAAPPVASVDELAPEPEPKERRDAAKRRPATLARETELLQSGLRHEQQGQLRDAARAFEALVARYPSSPLAPDARAALARVRNRLESSK